MISADELKSILHYEPETGKWTWLVDIPSRIKAGTTAGCLKKFKDKKRNIIKIRQREYLAARLAFLYMTGKFPSKLVDHKNRNPSDDRWINLREATHSENMSNKIGKPRKYDLPRGVSFDKKYQAKPYVVQCGNRKLGYFATIEEAVEVYNTAAKEKYGEFVFHGD